ncbi:MAG: flippase-like domain-containing protein [Caldilineaceae bacterium]|nr:flippase-like domain-containing protein [Caldilineaceae bacterium]
MQKRFLQYSQPVMVGLAVAFIFYVLSAQWEQLRDQPWRLHGGWLVISTLFLLASWGLEIAVWRYLLHLLGGYVPYATAARIWFLSAIVRYVPGNIWQPLSMTLRCRQHGVAPETTLTSVVLYQVVILLAAAPIAGIYFFATGNYGLITDALGQMAPWLAGLVLLPVLIFLWRPDWLIGILNWALRRIGRAGTVGRFTSANLLWALLLACADWMLWGASFAAITFALAAYTTAQMQPLLPHLLASYAIAYAVGFISFITPSGFGVREGAFYVLLAPLLGGGPVTVAALAMRIWTTLGEIMMAGVSALTDLRPAELPAPEKAFSPPE